jgi:CheY-like chemotaxis protein
MSHEIRTPVSGIIGLSEHLSDCGLTEEQMEFADNIRESAKFLLTLINNILDFSKMESGHMDMESIPFSLSKLVSDTLTPLRFQAEEKGLALTLNCDLPPDALFLGDPWRVRQILTNLVGNSLKFTKQGQIDVSVCCLEQGCTETVTVQYVIHDSGVGISEEALKRLFKPFSQADNSTARIHGGTGLGLVICQQLIELMGGHITLQSTLGEGTIATCNIPFLQYHGSNNGLLMEDILPHGARSPDNAGRTTMCPQWSRDLTCKTSMENLARCPDSSVLSATCGHVLLVEDNSINRKVIALAVKKLGYIVAIACDGQEALDYLCKQSVKPRPNAVLMDCMMPVVDGYEATRRIREDDGMFDEHVRALPIIALTASAIKGDREKCKEAGMDDYLTKPATRGVLKRTLETWIGLKRPQASDRSKSAC